MGTDKRKFSKRCAQLIDEALGIRNEFSQYKINVLCFYCPVSMIINNAIMRAAETLVISVFERKSDCSKRFKRFKPVLCLKN